MIQLEPLQVERIKNRLTRILQDNPNSLSMEGVMLQGMALLLREMHHLPVPRDIYADVFKFHLKFGLEYYGPPRFLPTDMHKHALAAMREEVQEYEDAINLRDLVKAHDALIDLVYFAVGRAILHGFPFREGWDLVQIANMLKERALPDGSNSKRGFGCDVIKPPGWTPPDHDPLFPNYVAPTSNKVELPPVIAEIHERETDPNNS